ncbi:MAG: sodium:calcium antiporter [Sumerlaeia bacterium]
MSQILPDSVLWNVVIFLIAGGVIAVAGTKLAGYADRLADRTGLGEAFVGALLLGAMTSLPGITTSFVAGWNGHASLAISNAIGGMAAQTVFLAIADICYRKANLEHAAASVPNIINGALLIALLGGILMASNAPEFAISGLGLAVHPVTPALFVAYIMGLKLSQSTFEDPAWRPVKTAQTVEDSPERDPDDTEKIAVLWTKFLAVGALTALCGWAVARTGITLSEKTGLSETVVGALFTAVATSTPELITAIAAVRQGALTLAVSNIIGGNAFDVLFAGAADVAYRDGSIYHAIADQERFLIALTVVMTAVLILGLMRREKSGVGNIGFEGALLIGLYAGGFLIVSFFF